MELKFENKFLLRFANADDFARIRSFWKHIFGCDDAYYDFLFNRVVGKDEILIFEHENEIVSILWMKSYRFRYFGVEIPCCYVGWCGTKENFRSQGLMRQLILEAEEVAKERDALFLVLVPADQSIVSYYERFSYFPVFESGNAIPQLSGILSKSDNRVEDAYSIFSSYYEERDMFVVKSFRDFENIVTEASFFDFPQKKSLFGMVRIVDYDAMLSIFFGENPSLDFFIELENNRSIDYFLIKGDVHERMIRQKLTECELVHILFGLPDSLSQSFESINRPIKLPELSYMLE